jgi:hypothetical protein
VAISANVKINAMEKYPVHSSAGAASMPLLKLRESM